MARASVHTYQKQLINPLVKLKDQLNIKQKLDTDRSKTIDNVQNMLASRSPTAINQTARTSKHSTLLLINESSVNQMRTASRPSKDMNANQYAGIDYSIFMK